MNAKKCTPTRVHHPPSPINRAIRVTDRRRVVGDHLNKIKYKSGSQTKVIRKTTKSNFDFLVEKNSAVCPQERKNWQKNDVFFFIIEGLIFY